MFITPVLVSQISHFRGARIHAKMAKHACNHSNKRNKDVFEQLMTSLKQERMHLRRNTIMMYVLVLSCYALSLTIFLVNNTINGATFSSVSKHRGLAA